MRTQISQSGVQVDVDAPKGQDLSLVMEEMRANYEKMALNNAKDLKVWHENQVARLIFTVSRRYIIVSYYRYTPHQTYTGFCSEIKTKME